METEVLSRSEETTRQRTPSESMEAMKCVGFHELKDWQIQQYRQAVNEHRTELSQQLNRCVSWIEAELDFLENDCFGQAARWRNEYCGSICPSRERCLLAARMLNKQLDPALPCAG